MAVSIQTRGFDNYPVSASIRIIDWDGNLVQQSIGFVVFTPEPYKNYRITCELPGYVSYANTLTFPSHDLNLVIHLREVECEPDDGSGLCCYVNYYIVDDLCTGGKIFYNLVAGNEMYITFPEDSKYKDLKLGGNIIYLYPVDHSVDKVYVHFKYRGGGCCCDEPGYECEQVEEQNLEYDTFYAKLALNAMHLDPACVSDIYKPFINHHELSYYYKDFLYLKKDLPVKFSGTLIDISQSLLLASSPLYPDPDPPGA